MKLMSNGESAQFLHDSGLLYEINRVVLHPLGFALAVEGNVADGSQMVGFNGLQDHRDSDDGEGVLFLEDSTGPDRLAKFMAAGGIERMRNRFRKLGFIIQPNPKRIIPTSYPDEEAASVAMAQHGGTIEDRPHVAEASKPTDE